MHLHIIGATATAGILYLVLTMGSTPQNNLNTSVSQIGTFFGANNGSASVNNFSSNLSSGILNNSTVNNLANSADSALNKLHLTSLLPDSSSKMFGSLSQLANNSKLQTKVSKPESRYGTGAYRYTKKDSEQQTQNEEDHLTSINQRLNSSQFRIEEF